MFQLQKIYKNREVWIDKRQESSAHTQRRMFFEALQLPRTNFAVKPFTAKDWKPSKCCKLLEPSQSTYRDFLHHVSPNQGTVKLISGSLQTLESFRNHFLLLLYLQSSQTFFIHASAPLLCFNPPQHQYELTFWVEMFLM